MSELPISSPYRSTPDAEVTESERERVNARLNAAYESGGLGAEDFQARLDQLFAAQRLGELVHVVDGLPPLQTHQTPAVVAPSGGRPGELSQTRGSSTMTLVALGAVGAAVLLVVLVLILVVL